MNDKCVAAVMLPAEKIEEKSEMFIFRSKEFIWRSIDFRKFSMKMLNVKSIMKSETHIYFIVLKDLSSFI